MKRPKFMKRAVWLAGSLLALAVTACSSGSGAIFTVSHQGQTYRTSTGWTIVVPRSWRVVHFSDAKDGYTVAGIQLSSIKLPRPVLIAACPQQTNGLTFPVRAISLVIAADTNPDLHLGAVAVTPLPYPEDWVVPSTLPNRPYVERLWFSARGSTLLACAEIGPQATNSALDALGATLHSLRP
jgi:hypothetical protein